MKQITKFINESISNPVEDYPKVETLGTGEFEGILWGHCFLYEGQKYYSGLGWMNMFPSYCKMEINEDKAIPRQVDQYQRSDLKKLFD